MHSWELISYAITKCYVIVLKLAEDFWCCTTNCATCNVIGGGKILSNINVSEAGENITRPSPLVGGVCTHKTVSYLLCNWCYGVNTSNMCRIHPYELFPWCNQRYYSRSNPTIHPSSTLLVNSAWLKQLTSGYYEAYSEVAGTCYPTQCMWLYLKTAQSARQIDF